MRRKFGTPHTGAVRQGLASEMPPALEQPAQGVAPDQRDRGEDRAQRKVVSKARVQAKPGEHHDLCDHRQRVSQHDIGYGVEQRHAARLDHARFLDWRAGFRASSSTTKRFAFRPVAISHRRTATSQ